MGRLPKVSRKKLCAELLRVRIGSARLSGIDFVDASGLDLRGLDIRGIVFTNVNFSHCNLSHVSMEDALFRNCTFTFASIDWAHLDGARFVDCNLRNVYFCRTTATRSRFTNCDLTYAKFTEADVSDAYFGDSTLDQTDFGFAKMCRADLDEALKTETIRNGMPIMCPEKGGFTAYKQCVDKLTGREIVVELYIPASAKRTSSTSRKCRASAAKVKGFYRKSGDKISKEDAKNYHAVSHYNSLFEYKIGDTVVPQHPFEENRWHECASGIHFFLTFEEAAKY